MCGWFLLSTLFSLPASPDSVKAVAAVVSVDSLRPSGVGIPPPKDSSRKALPDSLARKPAAAIDSVWLPDWTLRLGGSVGTQFPSFKQRTRFRSDVAAVVARDSLTLTQPLQSSELAPLLGVELSLQWKRSLRLVAEGQWCGWWNDARASRDSVVRNWSATVQVWRLGLGPDFMISPRVFTIAGMGPLVVETRGWLVSSTLDARGVSKGAGAGWSAGLASSMVNSRHFEVGGRIRWHQEEVLGEGAWADLLELDPSKDAPRWSTGGLAIGIWSTFDLGW
ncbi:MAG: hypothetical protein RL318_2352 [Fibrobacterota bacterium]|jgi:hypothetical protein